MRERERKEEEVEAKVLRKKNVKRKKEQALSSPFLPLRLPSGTHLARDLGAMAVVFV